LLESVHEKCLCHELKQRGIEHERHVLLPVSSKGCSLESDLRMDIVPPRLLIVEVKAVDALHPIHEAQLLTYLKLSGIRLGLPINFNVLVLKDGLKRLILELFSSSPPVFSVLSVSPW
jgi:GxxExxY protein